jgi:hypothetical protein
MTLPSAPEPQDDRYYALGQVVELAAVMEIALRMAFCALIGGRYAAVVAGWQETHWLIENCDAITRHRDDIPEPQRVAIRTSLRACREANQDRNRLVHEAWGTGTDGTPAALRSLDRSYQIIGRAWSTAQIRAAAEAISSAQYALLAAMEDALGSASMHEAAQLLAADAAERGR